MATASMHHAPGCDDSLELYRGEISLPIRIKTLYKHHPSDRRRMLDEFPKSAKLPHALLLSMHSYVSNSHSSPHVNSLHTT